MNASQIKAIAGPNWEVQPPEADCRPCKKCKRPVFEGDAGLVHWNAEDASETLGITLQLRTGRVGCQAASYGPNGWDRSIPKSWKAS